MFRLSKRTDYGLIALKHLALHNEEAHSAPEIARTYNIPSELLAKVLQKLVRKGLLESHSGPTGGYLLNRLPESISVIDVIEALEGPVLLTPCEGADDCEQLQLCSIRDPLRGIKEKVIQVLMDTTVHELAEAELLEMGSQRTVRIMKPLELGSRE
jgi:Rrf2 family protein